MGGEGRGEEKGRDGGRQGWGGEGRGRVAPKAKAPPPELFSWRRRCDRSIVRSQFWREALTLMK